MNEDKLIKRDYSLDSLKFILIVFVVFGHVLEEFGTKGALGTIRSMIYCFHMPVFVFLSGYFSKEASPKKLVNTCLMPFFIFNTAYILLAKHSYNILNPAYLYWYLLSLFFWRLLIIPFQEKKKLLIISLLLGIFAGYINEADRFLSISRTICFFPYFVAGNIFSEADMKKLRNIPHWIPIITLAFCENVVVFLDRTKIMPAKMYELIEGYQKTLGNIDFMAAPWQTGWGLRTITYIIGFTMVFGILSLTRETSAPSTISNWGKRTLNILVFSGFAVKTLFFAFKYVGINYKAFTLSIQLILAIPITIIMLILCGNKWICSIKLFPVSS